MSLDPLGFLFAFPPDAPQVTGAPWDYTYHCATCGTLICAAWIGAYPVQSWETRHLPAEPDAPTIHEVTIISGARRWKSRVSDQTGRRISQLAGGKR